MLKKVKPILPVLITVFAFVLNLYAGNIPVNNGTAVFEGKSYPVYQGVKAASDNKESIYGRGINYMINAKSLNESEKIAKEVVKFYANKNAAGIAIKNSFKETKSKSEIFFKSENKGVSVMIVAMKTGVSVVIIPD